MKNKARHAFGSENNIDSAIAAGKLDAYDLLFLDEGKIGWIDKDLNKVILQNDIVFETTLPDTGKDKVLYLVNGKAYTWDSSEGKYKEELVNADVEDKRITTDADEIIIDPETKTIKAIVNGEEIIINSQKEYNRISTLQIESLFEEETEGQGE